MADDIKTDNSAESPSAAAIESALKEYRAANDRLAVLAKYQFLVKILNTTTRD